MAAMASDPHVATTARPTLALLIPRFPQQTHIAWWRVGNAMRELGITVILVSTSRPPPGTRVHSRLEQEAASTHYVWPPKVSRVVRSLMRPRMLLRALRYILSLQESGAGEKLKAVPILISAMDLRGFCLEAGVDAVFVHSCADAAHLAAMCRAMGGPPYALRLGGDLEVYGKDHASKMAAAEFVLSAAPQYFDEIQARANIERSRLEWAWVGVDTSRFRPGPAWPDKPQDAPLHAITVARLSATKGHLDVLKAIARLGDEGVTIRYTVVGAGPMEQDLRTAIGEFDLHDRVDLVGPRDTAEVAAFLAGADVHVLASFGLGEAAPAAVSEAMACGLPAICTRIGATPLMVRDGIDGILVEQQSVDGLAAALRMLAQEPGKLRDMKLAARADSEKFDVTRTAKGILGRFGLSYTEPG